MFEKKIEIVGDTAYHHTNFVLIAELFYRQKIPPSSPLMKFSADHVHDKVETGLMLAPPVIFVTREITSEQVSFFSFENWQIMTFVRPRSCFDREFPE